MRLISCFAIVLFSLASCGSSSKKDDLHYSEEKLTQVMQDLYVASEVLKKLDPEAKDSFNALLRNQIETIHGVDISLIEEDISKLEKTPKRYSEMHKIVRDSLISLEAVVNAMSYD